MVFGMIPLGQDFVLQPGLRFNTYGNDVDIVSPSIEGALPVSGTFRITQRYLSLPLRVRYSIQGGPRYLVVGPEAGYLVSEARLSKRAPLKEARLLNCLGFSVCDAYNQYTDQTKEHKQVRVANIEGFARIDLHGRGDGALAATTLVDSSAKGINENGRTAVGATSNTPAVLDSAQPGDVEEMVLKRLVPKPTLKREVHKQVSALRGPVRPERGELLFVADRRTELEGSALPCNQRQQRRSVARREVIFLFMECPDNRESP